MNTEVSDTGNYTWGYLEKEEKFGRKSAEDDYIVVDKQTVSKQYQVDREASHCLIYAKCNAKVFDVYCRRAIVLLQMRFDGYLGFPGGLVDHGEDDLSSLKRELVEEINFDESKYTITPDHYVVSHYNTKTRILLHFYAFEVKQEEINEVERRTYLARDYGTEVLGSVRVPLYVMGDGLRGLGVFLRHQFIGNSRIQLLYTLEKLGILKKDEIERALASAKKGDN